MASNSSTSADGRRTVQFVRRDRKRRSIRLGKMPMKAAEEVLRRVELLSAAIISGTAPDNDTARWLASTSDVMHAKLAAVGLAEPRATPSNKAACLGEFIDHYIAGRTDVQPQTILNLRMFGDRLIAFFGRDKDMTAVKQADADAWVIFLKGKYAPGTWGGRLKGRGNSSRPRFAPNSSTATRSRASRPARSPTRTASAS
jgi:hypothetical protein